MLVTPAPKERADDFFKRAWPEARVASDPEKRLYAAFGLAKGTLRQLFGLGSMKSGLAAFRRGFRVGRPVGDPFQMSGAFLIEDGRVLREHRYEHAGDHPEWTAFARVDGQ